FENYLVRLIRDTIARGKWSALPGYLRFGGTAPMAGGGMDEDSTELTPVDEQYDIGFYPPALAMVVRAPSHYRPYVKDPNAPTGDAGGGMGFNQERNRPNAPQFAKNDPNRLLPPSKSGPAAGNGAGNRSIAKADPIAGLPVAKTDPKAYEEWKSGKPRKEVTAKEWEEAIA